MPSFDIPLYGNLALCLILASAAYTFAMALGATRGRPQLLGAARAGTFATVAFIALAVAVLAYAFQPHDFRIRYVARYSDRSMPWYYLIASLWGGQDGSLLWWTFLLGGYTAAVTRWMRGRLTELQPWVIATLMSIIGFFTILQLFAANPFATYVAAAPADGEGLNPLLQNYWMTIHPPSLYMGFVGWSVPFAFVIAALCTGRMHDEWIKAARPWAMIAWTFLSLGLLLGCVWSYEELGWGGYWAWDPVENASFMPWLVGTAYLHSAMVQERYGMLKVWNVFLMILTFFMTIFGTMLTRSGLIASVHAFAKTDIGGYFIVYLAIVAVVSVGLVVWRLPQLKAEHRIEALLSREFFFLLNNWVLLVIMVAVLYATTYPLLSEWWTGETVTIGERWYNHHIAPLGILLLFLTGAGPLISWRKATGKNLAKAFRVPVVSALVALGLYLALAGPLGYAIVVEVDPLSRDLTDRILAGMHSFSPLLTIAMVAFVVSSIAQEYVRGVRVRMRSKKESALMALLNLVSRARRRYGGYLVHVGLALMYFGFAGAMFDQTHEAALRVGATMDVGSGMEVRYDGPRELADPNKRMLFADLTVLDEGDPVGTGSPAKFIYRTAPEMPTTEVAIRSRPDRDVYMIMSTVDPETRRGTFRIVVRPLVLWIWLGGALLLLGALISMWPKARDLVKRRETLERLARLRRPRRAAVAATLALLACLAPAVAQAQDSSSLHAGTVEIHDPEERHLFGQLLCQCGDCQRLPLDTCACGWAEDKRAELREQLAVGVDKYDIIEQFRGLYGAAAIAVPGGRGVDETLWVFPLVAFVLFGGMLVVIGRRWRAKGAAPAPATDGAPGTDYDAALEDELARLEEDL